jgi:hypothetical protein
MSGKVIANAVNTNNDIDNSLKSFSISQSFYITEGDSGVDYYRNNCIALPTANTTNNIRFRSIELTSGSEFIVQYNQAHYGPTTVYLYPRNITDESILLDGEKSKILDFKGSKFININEKRFSVTVPHIHGVFTVVIFEGITDESEAIYILRDVKVVNIK